MTIRPHKHNPNVLIRDEAPIYSRDGKRVFKLAGAEYANEFITRLAAVPAAPEEGTAMQTFDKLDRSPIAKANDAVAQASMKPYTPGMTMAMSDEELSQTISRGAPSFPRDPIPREIYEARALYDEAVVEQKRRAGYNALQDPARSAVQMQTGTPAKPVGQMKPAAANATTMSTPATMMTDDQLAAAATAAPDSLPYGELTGADYQKVQAGREARREIMRRSLSPDGGKRINPTNWG